MKTTVSLLVLIVAFPLLYVSSAILMSDPASSFALLVVAGVCVYLLAPDRKA